VPSREIVELALKGLLRSCAVDAPRIHDVSDVLVAELERPTSTSRDLRRDRASFFLKTAAEVLRKGPWAR
jgi:HEPN domain-containing protein